MISVAPIAVVFAERRDKAITLSFQLYIKFAHLSIFPADFVPTQTFSFPEAITEVFCLLFFSNYKQKGAECLLLLMKL